MRKSDHIGYSINPLELVFSEQDAPNRQLRIPGKGFMSAFFSRLVSRLSQLRNVEWTPTRVWIGIFGFWLFLLTGVTHQMGAGSPGLFQYGQLSALLDQRHAEATETDLEIAKLEAESDSLAKSRVVQEREIRKTMGYVAENEMIFDFSLSGVVSLRR